MNKLIEGALDIVGGTEIGEQVTKLKDNVLETVGVQTETKEALQEASLDQVATTYEALASKVGITDQKETITKFIVKGKGEDEFIELHTKIKSLAQKGGTDVSTLDDVLTTHKLTGGSKIGFTIANALGGFVRKTLEKLNFINSPKDLGKMVFTINEITTKIDVSRLDKEGETPYKNTEEGSNEKLKNWDGTDRGLQGIAKMPLVGGIVKKTGKLGDDRGDHEHEGEDYALEGNVVGEISASLDMVVTKIDFQKDGAGWYLIGETHAQGKVIETKYMHLAEEPNIKVGDLIKQGEVFAKEGATGGNYKPHLHFELRIDGKLQDPGNVFLA